MQLYFKGTEPGFWYYYLKISIFISLRILTVTVDKFLYLDSIQEKNKELQIEK